MDVNHEDTIVCSCGDFLSLLDGSGKREDKNYENKQIFAVGEILSKVRCGVDISPKKDFKDYGKPLGYYCFLVSALKDKKAIVIRDVLKNKKLIASQEERFTALKISKSQEFLIGGSENSNLYVWRLSTGSLLRIRKTGLRSIDFVQVSRQDIHIILVSKTSVIVYPFKSVFDNPSMKDVSEMEEIYKLEKHSLPITDIRVSLRNIITSSYDRSVRIFDLYNGTELKVIEYPETVLAIEMGNLDRGIFAGTDQGRIIETNLYPKKYSIRSKSGFTFYEQIIERQREFGGSEIVRFSPVECKTYEFTPGQFLHIEYKGSGKIKQLKILEYFCRRDVLVGLYEHEDIPEDGSDSEKYSVIRVWDIFGKTVIRMFKFDECNYFVSVKTRILQKLNFRETSETLNNLEEKIEEELQPVKVLGRYVEQEKVNEVPIVNVFRENQRRFVNFRSKLGEKMNIPRDVMDIVNLKLDTFMEEKE